LAYKGSTFLCQNLHITVNQKKSIQKSCKSGALYPINKVVSANSVSYCNSRIRLFFVYLSSMKNDKYHIEIEIDKLTNSIENAISEDSFPTEIYKIERSDFKHITKTKGWLFNWRTETKLNDREVYKLTISGNPNVIQGLVSISDYKDHIYLHLKESAPFNIGRHKLYKGVPGNLFAFACKRSWENGYEGFASFTAKTKLIEHYEKSLGAIHAGGHKMIIFPDVALKLI